MSDQHNSCAKGNFSKLIVFRQAAYGLMGKAQDALFELTDAVIQVQHPGSFVELSCAPAFRRKWSSAYEALQDGQSLPWQRSQLHLTPGRACQGMQAILVAIGTPTRVCKPRGIAPGWPIGRIRTHRERFDLIFSKRWRVIRAHQKPKRGRPKKIKPILTA